LIFAAVIVALGQARGDEFDYARDVQPLLGRHCLACHGGEEAEGKIDFSILSKESDRAEQAEILAKALVQVNLGAMPPEDEVQPSEREREELVAGLERLLEEISLRAPPDPGRVTMRRLNREEYNNTIRDLVGLDLRPADEFPLDDSRDGFDNNGDALSLPPLLLEKYLDAAERVLDKVIVRQGPFEPLEAAIEGESLGKRAAAGEFAELKPDEEVSTKVAFPRPGDYEIRLRAARGNSTERPAMLVVKIDGIDVTLLPVESDDFAEYTATFPAGVGERSVAVRNSRPSAQQPKAGEQDPDVRLLVDRLEIAGPRQLLAHRAIFFVAPTEEVSEREAARQILERFAKRAFRRPLAAEERNGLMALYDAERGQARPHVEAVRVVLWSVLVSPHFLFRVETDQPADEGGYRLNDWELANRLSFFLWSSMPDEELFRLAAEGKVHEPETLRAQSRRMLADPKSQALVENFAGQWLGLRKLESAERDAAMFPTFTDSLRQAMRQEALLLFETVLREEGSIFKLLNADYTFLNEELAKHYGVRDVRGRQMRRVTLADENRGGVLTMASTLTVTSLPTRTSPVNRGKWILEEILGTPPPPPPPNVPALEETKADRPDGKTLTLRERLALHREDSKCASCHRRMDVLGLGLENFDAVGRWRDEDAGRPIDASGDLPGGESFTRPAELKEILTRNRQTFARAFTEKMLTYALGRSLTWSDRREVRRIAESLAAKDYRMTVLIQEIIASYPFQNRKHGNGGVPQSKDSS
jgi:hypothetical protein